MHYGNLLSFEVREKANFRLLRQPRTLSIYSIWYSFITILRLPFVWNATRRILRNRSRQRPNRRRRRRWRWRHPESGATAWWEAGNTCWLRHIKPTRSSGCADNPLIKRQCSSHRCMFVLLLSLPPSLRLSVCLSTCLQSIPRRRELPGLRRLEINHQYNGDCVAAEWWWWLMELLLTFVVL